MAASKRPWMKKALQDHQLLHGLFVINMIIACCYAQTPENVNITRSEFPKDFVFGVATSAIQTEGSANKGGRTPSIWDTYANLPGKIIDGSDCSQGVDHYNRYKGDVSLLKDLGVDSYRFSISWSRILPQGSLSGGINQEGIDHYNNLINELIYNGITPFVTILHFDTPQALENKYGGFLNRSIVDDYKDYCDILFKTYGDRVKNWVTINEPFIVAFAYDLGKGAPGRCSLPAPIGPCPAGNSATEPYIVSHNFILAHATAVKLYREKYQAQQGGQIGPSIVAEFMEPLTDKPEDIAAAERYMDFVMGWYIEPLVFGEYPKTMVDNVKERLPIFTPEEKLLIKGAFDFIAINYYTSRYALNSAREGPPHYLGDFLVKITTMKDGTPIGPKSEGSGYIYSYPMGLQKVLEFMKLKYNNPKIYITENGYPEANVRNRGLDIALDDSVRIKFILQHLYHTNQAIKNGVNVKGYFYWTLFDDFEFGSGFTMRFGLYYIDYRDDFRRIPKKSASWLARFLSKEGQNAKMKRQLIEEPEL